MKPFLAIGSRKPMDFEDRDVDISGHCTFKSPDYCFAFRMWPHFHIAHRPSPQAILTVNFLESSLPKIGMHERMMISKRVPTLLRDPSRSTSTSRIAFVAESNAHIQQTSFSFEFVILILLFKFLSSLEGFGL